MPSFLFSIDLFYNYAPSKNTLGDLFCWRRFKSSKVFFVVETSSFMTFMLSPERIKELFEDTRMSDKQATEIRDSLTAFVRKVLDKWIQESIIN